MDSRRIPKEPFSAANPVPKVAHLFRNVVDPQSTTNSKARKLATGRKDAKRDQKRTEDAVNRMARGQTLRVQDPVTGEETTIKNADEEANIEQDTTNFRQHPLPEPNWPAHGRHVNALTTQTLLGISAAYTALPLATYFFFSILPALPLVGPPRTWHVGRVSLAPGTPTFWALNIVMPSFIAYVLIYRLHAEASKDYDAHVWDAERKRGETSVMSPKDSEHTWSEKGIHESAEWGNGFLKELWPCIDPGLFTSVVDMLEDVMQASMPRIVHSIRVSDLGQGGIAPRITGIRALPLRRTEEGDVQGEHVNLELSFAYHANPSGASASSKAQNAHIVVDFFVGARGFFGVQIPVWVEVSGVIGTARARLELLPGPPFVKTAVVTLLGLPRISISVVPLHQRLTNIMNLPLVSTFISNSVNTAVAEYVAPKSLKLDVQRLISGDDVKRDTDAIGILVVTIHRATGLKAGDIDGGSDPYVTLAFSRLGKPLFSTRIISGRSPVWEETTIALVGPDAIAVREKLSLQLWDSDRFTADDVLGTVDIDIATLIHRKNQSFRSIEPITKGEGSLEFTVGFYEKAHPNPAFRAEKWKRKLSKPEEGESNETSKPSPDSIDMDGSSEDDEEIIRPDNVLNDLEAAVMTCAPDPELPSGILSIQVHELRDLGFKLNKGTKGRGHGPGSSEEEEEEEGDGLPSAYCVVLVNDQKIYKTRVKPITASPFFNAATERFCKDWRRAHVTIIARDSRMRENNPIIGATTIKLSEAFSESSQFTQLCPLEGGIGYGRIRVSLLFRPTTARLPANILGFSIGTLQIFGIKALPDSEHTDFQDAQVNVQTSDVKERISRKAAEAQEDGSVEWNPEKAEVIQLPIQKRHGAALILKFTSKRALGPQKTIAHAALWLRDLVDGERTTMTVALWDAGGESAEYIQQNYIPPLASSESKIDPDGHDAKQIGAVELDISTVAGLGDIHQKILDGSDPLKKQKWQEYEVQDAAGLRETVGLDQEGQPGIQEPEGQNFKIEDDQADDQALRSTDDEWTDTRKPHDPDGTEEDSESEGGGRRGPVRMFKDWRQHEHELHREHRGFMQTKPVRTANWLKDGVKKGGHKVQQRFAQHSREPEIETEV
ncbi:Meiotically up-regulated gene 190 protein OS=Schizosaccharomyces pombe (strain 972 / ATCC 24843) GN=mug190 PE=1 SV=1 [Rhizoctonia solani AG-1 IB]|uniref:Meiotically up-regulated gene 190 protein n=2 Tax=Thanatephorus cucumeris (strain AG1-IB / isolate 7/3/14) TaxID=1108050 RepID=A0A0B7FGW8_THACB|nr:Meiotically up-regulated gene 190 protein OS=Schizosaccharomyces pombe (strain 972 / ATCC 24843) GN=mug190 PE=1 SV=1 [Rhizoctonia solani AG-1 IB]